MNTPVNENTYFGNYRVVKHLASGSFSHVYLARHKLLSSRTVAIKLLHSTHLNSVEEKEQFLQEAEFLADLKHRYILTFIEFGIHDGCPYLVEEYAPNGTLRDLLQHQSPAILPHEQSLTILSQIGTALYYAHNHNIVHRDLKPSNILFNARGDALLADFGLATMLDTASIKQVNYDGTPRYMAPEQFQGNVSKESDQYSLGIIAYELFTGQVPFTAKNFFAVGNKHIVEAPPSPTQLNPALPSHIEQAILKSLAKQRSDRYASVDAFIKALHNAQSPSITSTPISYQQPQNASTQLLDNDETLIKTRPSDTLKESSPQKTDLLPTVSVANHNKSKRRLFIIASTIFVLILLVFSSIFIFSPAIHPPSATITITPKSTKLKNIFKISMVTGQPDPSQLQVAGARVVVETKSQSNQVASTGSLHVNATQASGTLTVENHASISHSFNAGQYSLSKSNITVLFSISFTVSPNSVKVVPAYTNDTGAKSNIPAYDVNDSCCGDSQGGYVAIYNTQAFTGGRDAKDYPEVQQSDRDNAANQMKEPLISNAQTELQKQRKMNENLVGSVQCISKVTSDHAIGDLVANFNVTVSVTCSNEVYDPSAAQATAVDLLKNQAASDLSNNYILAGKVTPAVKQVIITDTKLGTLSLLVETVGLWIYRFSEAQKHNLVQLVANKNVQDAKTLLLSQEGVGNVMITLSGGNQNTLPLVVSQIQIVLLSVPG